MTKHRSLIGASILVAGVVLPRAGRAQNPGQPLQQQQQQAQQEVQQQTIEQQQQQIQQLQMQSQAEAATHYRHRPVPEHLQIGSQQYDASPAGFRAYVETLKAVDPSLYGQLAPDVARLEAKRDTAISALIAGVAVGVASTIYGIASRDTCTGPAVTDPNFGADTEAWGACNDRNLTRMATFSFIGLGAVLVGGVIAWVNQPGRPDIMELVNKHNRLNKQPLQLQIGYDPTQRFAFSGATVSF